MSKKIYAFYTINQLGDWKQVMSSQVTKIIKSGLFDELTRVFTGTYGNETSIALPAKFSVIHKSSDASSPAMEMLDIIGNFARNNDCLILNFCNLHSEYYGRGNYTYVQDWRECLEHFNINSWKECVARLENYEAVGIDWRPNGDGTGRFDGNYWWARSSYLAKLPTLEHLRSNNITVESLKDHWIGMNKPKAGVLFNSDIENHLKAPTPKSLYLDGFVAPSVADVSQPMPRAKREPALEPMRSSMTPRIVETRTAPPLIPIRHSGPPPSLHAKKKVGTPPSMKLIIDCRKSDSFAKTYLDIISRLEAYEKFSIRVALFNDADYTPIKNFICYGPNLCKDVIASLPFGIDGEILYIDASVEPLDTDQSWLINWSDNLNKLRRGETRFLPSDDKAYVAWMKNTEIDKIQA